jgi:hypothetical protein
MQLRQTVVGLAFLLVGSSVITTEALEDSRTVHTKVDAIQAFDTLKKLKGEWQGTTESNDGPVAKVTYHVTASGSTLMETLFPGTSHEMISMYHIDGENLVITHYCAMGNQPRMQLSSATPAELKFDFAGGTNLDAKKDLHIHSGRIRLLSQDRIESEWNVYEGMKAVGANRLFLTRKK